MKRTLTLSLILLYAMLCEGCAAPNTVGAEGSFDADGVTLKGAAPYQIQQTDVYGGTTTVTAPGPVQQTYIEPDGTLKAIGGGVANKVIALPVGGGKSLLVASQDDATFEAREIRDGATGRIVAKGVKVSTNVTNPTLAAAEGLKAWGPIYVEAVKQARLGNRDQYEAVTKSLDSTMPVVLTLLQAAFGIP